MKIRNKQIIFSTIKKFTPNILMKIVRRPLYFLRQYFWFRGLYHLHKPLISEGDLVFDVGANVGDFTLMFRKMKTKVIAIDPNPNCIEILKKRYSTDNNVIIKQYGLGNIEEDKSFYFSLDTDAEGSLLSDWKNKKDAKTITVNITTLDKLIELYGQPKFIKIDVEGFEDKVLEGLKSNVLNISFEFQNKRFDKTIRCLELVDKLGNKEYNFIAYGTKFALSNWVGKDQIIKILKSKDLNFSGDIFVREIK